jgi:hypothetical protein
MLQGILAAARGGPGAADVDAEAEAEAGDAATATEESTAAGPPAPVDEVVVDLQQQPDSAGAGDVEQVLRQRAEVLKSMWGRLETTLDPGGATARHVDVAASEGEQEAEAEEEAARTEMSTGALEVSVETPLPVDNSEEGHAHLPERPGATGDGTTDVTPTGWGRHPPDEFAEMLKAAEADAEALISRYAWLHS